jgi:hypothetical protein
MLKTTILILIDYIGGNGGLIWGGTSPLCYLDLNTNNVINVTTSVTGSNLVRTITGNVRCLEFDISDPTKLYIGGKISYQSSDTTSITYNDVFLGLIMDTPSIAFPNFYIPPTSTTLYSGDLYTILSVSNEKLYLGGLFTYTQTSSIPFKDAIRNLCLFNPTTKTFNPISTVTITSLGPTFTSVLFPNNLIRTINIGNKGILHIGGDFTNLAYINPNLGNVQIPLIGTGTYAEYNTITKIWSSYDRFNTSVNTIIFRKNESKTKNNIIVGGFLNFGNNYTSGLVIYTNNYINLVVDDKTLITLTENGSMATISSNKVCGKTSGFLYTNSNYDPFLN